MSEDPTSPLGAGGAARARRRGGRGTLAPGAMIRDYRVVATLGEGGFGTIYRAEHAVIGRQVAIKVLHAELLGAPDAMARFEREARAVNLIRHPSVVDVFDFGELPDGRPFFVMELLEGEDLATRLRRGRLPLDAAIAVIAPLGDALAAAHAKGLVHRDVKASNVFLARRADGGERVVLLDFGIVHLHEPGGADLTSSRHVLGTPGCMAPEQLYGRAVDARTDVYALGALLFHVLAGEPPWAAVPHEARVERQLSGPPPRLGELVNVPAAVDALVARAMAREPDDRFASIADLLATLHRAAREPAPVEARGAVGLYLETRADGDAAAVEAWLARASALAAARGYVAAFDGTESCLLVRAAAGEDARAAAESDARAIWVASAPPGGAAELCAIYVSAGEVRFQGAQPVGGALLRVASWVPASPAHGVHAIDAAHATPRRLA